MRTVLLALGLGVLAKEGHRLVQGVALVVV